MIEVEQLRKSYGEIVAVDRISFTVAPGEIFGLLGPNGAGKTTTIHCVSGLLPPDQGCIRIMNLDIRKDGAAARRQLGLVPQEVAIYEDLTAEENLAFWGGACGLRGRELRERVREALGLIGLGAHARRQVKQFSGGMKRRLNFACGILHRPPVLLLDEPAVGVDPQSRARLLDLVRQQARSGVCVLYTTHYMEEAEALCDRLGIMDRGRMIAQGTLAELRAMVGERDTLRLRGVFPEPNVREALAGASDVEILQAAGDSLLLSVRDGERRLASLLGALNSAGAEVREATLAQPSLETLFLRLTGKELRE